MLRFHKLKQADLALTDWQKEPLSAMLPGGAHYYETMLREGNTLFVLFDDQMPVGILEMEAEPVGEKPKCAVVGNVLLLPEYRRRGLGRMLMCLAAGEAAGRQLWFLAGAVPETGEAAAFARAIHMKQTHWFDDMLVLDLSDVEGLRHG